MQNNTATQQRHRKCQMYLGYNSNTTTHTLLFTMDSVEFGNRHRIEAKDSWELYTKRMSGSAMSGSDTMDNDDLSFRRRLTHHHHHTFQGIEDEKRWTKKQAKKRKKNLKKLYYDPGIKIDTIHGMMIDAGSSGSRMHIYEFQPRILQGKKEIAQAVSGKKLSYPGTMSRWTERLQPGIASFASLPDDQLFGVSPHLKVG
jgi:hypothetical protein